MKYMIATQKTPGNLAFEVNKLLEKGWQPLGAPIYSVEGDYRWSQALISGYEVRTRVVGPNRGYMPG